MTVLAYHPKELAKLLGISVKTLEKRRRSGDGIPFAKIGRRIVYPATYVDRYLVENTFSSTSEYRKPRSSP